MHACMCVSVSVWVHVCVHEWVNEHVTSAWKTIAYATYFSSKLLILSWYLRSIVLSSLTSCSHRSLSPFLSSISCNNPKKMFPLCASLQLKTYSHSDLSMLRQTKHASAGFLLLFLAYIVHHLHYMISELWSWWSHDSLICGLKCFQSQYTALFEPCDILDKDHEFYNKTMETRNMTQTQAYQKWVQRHPHKQGAYKRELIQYMISRNLSDIFTTSLATTLLDTFSTSWPTTILDILSTSLPKRYMIHSAPHFHKPYLIDSWPTILLDIFIVSWPTTQQFYLTHSALQCQ